MFISSFSNWISTVFKFYHKQLLCKELEKQLHRLMHLDQRLFAFWLNALEYVPFRRVPALNLYWIPVNLFIEFLKNEKFVLTSRNRHKPHGKKDKQCTHISQLHTNLKCISKRLAKRKLNNISKYVSFYTKQPRRHKNVSIFGMKKIPENYWITAWKCVAV